MWYRIELNKDNSISSCEQAAGSRNEGRAVHYIEADNKSSAIALLLARYETNNQARRKAAKERADRLRSEALCRRCGREPVAGEGLTCCRNCLARRNSRHAERKAGAPVLLVAHSQESKIATQINRQQRDVAKAMRKAAGHLIMVRVAYARCLQAFDTMSSNSYRTWLSEALHTAQEKERASATRRSDAQRAAERHKAQKKHRSERAQAAE